MRKLLQYIISKSRAKAGLKEKAAFNKGVLNALSTRIAVVNASGIIISVNESWKNFACKTGIPDLATVCEGASYFNVCKADNSSSDDTAVKALIGLQQVLNNEIETFYLEYPCHSPTDEQWFYMHVKKFQSTEPLLVIEHHDITERKKAEAEIQKIIDRYTILAKATSDTIWDWDMSNNHMNYNQGITKMFGYDTTQIDNIADWWEQKIHPDDIDRIKSFIAETLEKKIQNIQLEYKFRCFDNSYKYILDRAFVLFDESGKPVRMIGAMQDITLQKEAEISRAKEIIHAQEEERQNIGLELHDNVNQILAGSLISLDLAKIKLTDTEKAITHIDRTRGYIENAIKEIRKLSHELAPDISENISFRELVEDLVTVVNPDNHLTIRLHFEGLDTITLNSDLSKNLYRILQEQLKNILKHAMASKIVITILHSDNSIKMTVSDNGKGFNISQLDKTRGIGLRNMQRRTELFNGKFELTSTINQGCEIKVYIPFNKTISTAIDSLLFSAS